MTEPRVSIMIITYNQLDFIEETVGSALEQDYDNLEVVVADDGSTDGTAAYLDDLSTKWSGRLVALTEGPNLGITRNSNRGLFACDGDLIAIQGGDDVLLPGKIKAQVEVMEQDDRIALSGHDVEYFRSEDDSTICLHSDFVPMGQGSGAADFVEQGPIYAATSVMVRASFLPSYGFDERLPTVSDGKLWIDTLASGARYVTTPGIYARYRRHAGNISATAKTRCNTERFMALAITEAEHPHLAEACRKGRARFYYTSGVQALLEGDVSQARDLSLLSLKTCPEYSWKLPLAAALAHTPAALQNLVLHRKRNALRGRSAWAAL